MEGSNATPPLFTVEVGDLDITELVGSGNLSIRRGPFDPARPRPRVWEGSMAIAKTDTWTGESLDNFVNPARWARGNNQVKITIDGDLLATLRIAEYTYDYRTNSAAIKLSQLLGMLDYKTPPEDYRFIDNNNSLVDIATIVFRSLTAAGIPSFDLSGIVSTVFVPPPNRTNTSYIGLAQQVLGERSHTLYHAPDETVKVKRYDKTATPAFERKDTECIDFLALQGSTDTPSVYRVTGGGEVYQDNCSLADAINQTEDIYGDRTTTRGYFYKGEYKPTRTTIGRAVVEQIITEVLRETPTLIQERVTGYKDLNLVNEFGRERTERLYKTYEITESRFYDDQGRLVRSERVKDGIAYGNFPDTIYDLDPDAVRWITGLETKIVEYSHDPSALETYSGYSSRRVTDRNVLRIKVETTIKRLPNARPTSTGGTRYELFTAPTEKIIDTWIEKCPDNPETTYLHQRKVLSRDPVYNYARQVPALVRSTQLFLQSGLSKSEDNARPPSWTVRPPLYPRTRSKLNVEVTRKYPGATFDLIEKRPFEYQAKSITFASEAYELAETFADLTVGRAFGRRVALSLRDATEYRANPEPMLVADIHDRRLLLDSTSLVIADNEAEITFDGVALKRLDPVVGAGTPIESDIGASEINISIPLTIQVQLRVSDFNTVDSPDLDLITIDVNGEIVTSGGFVQASENQNQFAQILVAENGSIVVSAIDGYVVTTSQDVYDPSVWNAIATFDGEVITVDGQLVTV